MHPVLIGIYAALGLTFIVLTFLVFEPCRKGSVTRGRAVVRDRCSFCRPSRLPRTPMGSPLPQSYPDTWLVVISIAGETVQREVDSNLYEQLLPGTEVNVSYGRGIITNRVRIIDLEVQ